MDRRTWHVEHGDGRRWTLHELCELYRTANAWFALNVAGALGVLYSTGDRLACDWSGPSSGALDMRVVFDG